MVVFTDLARLFVGVVVLSFASYTDWRWRRAPNVLWLILAGAGLLLIGIDALLAWDDLVAQWRYLAGIPAFVIAMYAAWYFGLIAGGADAKALMATALLMPFPIAITDAVPVEQSPMPGAFVVLADSLLAFLVIPVALLLVNLARRDFHFPAMLLGFKQRVSDLGKGHNWPMQTVEEDGKVRMRLFASRRPEQELEAMRARLQEKGVDRVWVTPKIPFMIPLLIGFITAFTLGDALFWMLSRIMGG